MTIDIMNHTEDRQLFSRIILASAVPVDIIDVVPANDATDYFEDNHAYLFDVLTKSLPLKLYNKHNACVVLPMCIFCEISADLSCDVAVYDESIYTCADILAAMQTALADERFVNAFRLNISSLFLTVQISIRFSPILIKLCIILLQFWIPPRICSMEKALIPFVTIRLYLALSQMG